MKATNQNESKQYLWWISFVFCLLALSFFFDVWGGKRIVKNNGSVEKKYFSTETVRTPLKEPKLLKEGEWYRCNDCHQSIAPSDVKKSFFSAHESVNLEHGVNNHCLSCHSRDNREFLVDSHGDDIDFTRSELSCIKCHGVVYNDWVSGAHGRINGYWDKTKGAAEKVTCVACHDPHAPQFKSMEPSPAPVILNYLNSIVQKDEPHE